MQQLHTMISCRGALLPMPIEKETPWGFSQKKDTPPNWLGPVVFPFPKSKKGTPIWLDNINCQSVSLNPKLSETGVGSSSYLKPFGHDRSHWPTHLGAQPLTALRHEATSGAVSLSSETDKPKAVRKSKQGTEACMYVHATYTNVPVQPIHIHVQSQARLAMSGRQYLMLS